MAATAVGKTFQVVASVHIHRIVDYEFENFLPTAAAAAAESFLVAAVVMLLKEGRTDWCTLGLVVGVDVVVVAVAVVERCHFASSTRLLRILGKPYSFYNNVLRYLSINQGNDQIN